MTDIESIKKELERTRKMQRNIRYFVLAFLCVSIFASLTYVYARNTRSDKGSTEYHSSEFFFSVYAFGDPELAKVSDDYMAFEIDQEETIKVFGTAEKTEMFEVRNFLDSGDGTDRITQDNIEYTVEAKWGEGSELNNSLLKLKKGDALIESGEESTLGESTLGGYAARKDTWKLVIPAKDELTHYEGERVVVTVKSTSPYVKTYTIIYELHVNAPIEKYWIAKRANVYELRIATYKGYDYDANKLEIYWPEELTIDESNPLTYTYEDSDGVRHFTAKQITEVTDSPYSSSYKGYKMAISQALPANSTASIYFFRRDEHSAHDLYLVEEINSEPPLDTKIYVREVTNE